MCNRVFGLTMNLLFSDDQLPDGWEGCDDKDCLPGCWSSEYHCERLAVMMKESGFTEEQAHAQPLGIG